MPRKNPRVLDRSSMGSGGDFRDRFRNVHKPGAYPTPEIGPMNPMVGLRKIGEIYNRKRRSPTTIKDR